MDQKVRIIIVDDNADSLDIMQYYIEQLPDFLIIDKCHNGEELLDSVLKTDPDVILLDINMPKLNGVEAIQACLKIKRDLPFIFITSYDEYAVKAFELSALDYIVKPIEKVRLYRALEKARNLNKQSTQIDKKQNQRLSIKDCNYFHYIPCYDILFIEKIGKKCHIHTSKREYTTNDNIGSLLNRLPDELFFLSHRSFIVNLTKISYISVQNQTYLAYFFNTSKYAHISKLKIEEVQNRIKSII